MSKVKDILRQIRLINADRQGLFDEQAYVEIPDESNLNLLRLELSPNCGPFANTRINFTLELPERWPDAAPKATCLNKIFHPNISTSGSVW